MTVPYLIKMVRLHTKDKQNMVKKTGSKGGNFGKNIY